MTNGTADLTLKEAGDDEIEAFTTGWLEEFAIQEALLGPGVWEWRPFRWADVIRMPRYQTMAAVSGGGQLEGLIAVFVLPSLDDPLEITYLQTSPTNFPPNNGRRGVGTALIRWALKRSEELGRDGVTLSSTPSGEKFYESLNFTLVPSRGNVQKRYQIVGEEVGKFLEATKLRAAGGTP